ncbi:Hsp20/alpha crystallin family protein [Alkalihalobacillus pseudalcaliphilus]|uniref:Hsp20/alpha crystallin family protein n=1 Tax=Alkalihalobacillus pseudalcaliphilus TaxID=79884 RepID=UPI00064D82C7|nr:Hsp20 family protein [Alkalihalobacillus pseudalcaliphilus]KMK76564.1 hypothetical protein AB990_15460 [Alkalihalobacillus pseudalcaliphilus]
MDHKPPEKIWYGMQNMLQSIDDFFARSMLSFQTELLFQQPIPIEIHEKTDGFYIHAQLDGVKKEQIELNIYPHSVQIIITHHETSDIIDATSHNHYQKAQTKKQARTIRVPFEIDYREVDTRFQSGLLKIKLHEKGKNLTI